MCLAMDLGNRGVFMELGKSKTDWRSSQDRRCTKWSEFRGEKKEERRTKNVKEKKKINEGK